MLDISGPQLSNSAAWVTLSDTAKDPALWQPKNSAATVTGMPFLDEWPHLDPAASEEQSDLGWAPL